jgi:hypothetical protein
VGIKVTGLTVGRGFAVLVGLAAAAVVSLVFIGSAGAVVPPTRPPQPAPGISQGPSCASPDLGPTRDPNNPLALPTAPTGGDPLQGAHFFVDGPLHGQAAGAIAQLLGRSSSSFSVSDSWDAFDLAHSAEIAANPQAAELAKIAGQEETQNISSYASGGGHDGIYNQTNKILCGNMKADPTDGTVPVLSTFIVYPNGQICPKTLGQILAWQNTFHADINGMAQAIGNKRAVILQEIDSLGTSGCLMGKTRIIQKGRRAGHIIQSTLDPRMKLWLSDLTYESRVFGALPHVVSYQEAGYSDNRSGKVGARTTAELLRMAGLGYVRGFWTNGTHFAWSQDEVNWANMIVSDIPGGSHYIVNTAQNGRGPLVPANRVKNGNEVLCNPSGRGLGRIPTAQTNPTFDGETFPTLDAFLWTGVPGRSHKSDCPGGPWAAAGVFDPRFAQELAQNANQQLSPTAGSFPY